jgi:hypothetical protein
MIAADTNAVTLDNLQKAVDLDIQQIVFRITDLKSKLVAYGQNMYMIDNISISKLCNALASNGTRFSTNKDIAYKIMCLKAFTEIKEILDVANDNILKSCPKDIKFNTYNHIYGNIINKKYKYLSIIDKAILYNPMQLALIAETIFVLDVKLEQNIENNRVDLIINWNKSDLQRIIDFRY